MENNKETVTAVTVTYNRTVTLKKCIDALLDQTRSIDHIIVVDNNSSSEEQSVLRKLASRHTQIHLIFLSENLGGAGGFESGMKEAREKYPADWYWIMDDDAYPRRDCLERLLEERANIRTDGKEIGFLAPLIFGVDLQEYQLYHHKYVRGLQLKDVPVVSSADELSEITRIDANAFVGPLFSAAAVERVGIADGGLFIYGDDTEYTYRVTRELPGYLIRSAVIEHQDPPLKSNYLEPKAWWKEYYSNRNRYFMVKKFHNSMSARCGAAFLLTWPMITQIAAAMIKPKYKGFRRLRVQLLVASVKDGLSNRRGKTIDPVAFGEMVRKMS